MDDVMKKKAQIKFLIINIKKNLFFIASITVPRII